MLTTDGGMLGLAIVVALLLVTAVIALFARPVAGNRERMKPFSLSDKDRVVLQAAALNIKNRGQQERKSRRRATRSREPAVKNPE